MEVKNGKKYRFKMANDLVAVRLEKGHSFQRVLRNSRSPREVASLRQIARFDEANVLVMQTTTGGNAVGRRDATRTSLKSSGVRFAGRVRRYWAIASQCLCRCQWQKTYCLNVL